MLLGHHVGLTPRSPGSLSDDLLLLLRLSCGPRGIRTLGLLNAIETRSQLRYGPKPARIVLAIREIVNAGNTSVSGPGGIRTLGLFSAIEARSQLRYRPLRARIVPFTILPVKAGMLKSIQ